MSADLSYIINIQVQDAPALAAADNPNVVALMSKQADGPLNTANRYGIYRDLLSVAQDFGSASETYDFAAAILGTSPNPTNSGGQLVIGHWRAATENYAASAAVLTGAQLVEATVVDAAQSISDGAFNIDVDGTTVNVTAVDLRTVTSLADIVAAITVTGATVTLSDDDRIVITSDTTGALSLITFATDPGTGTGTGLSSLLGLATGTGATTVQGAAAGSHAPETKVEAVTALKALVNFKGYCFIDATTDQESKDLATWGQAAGVLGYDTFSAVTNLNVDVTNPVWEIKLAGQKKYRMQYSPSGNRKLSASYMARQHVTDFNGENTALTMQLKELAIQPEAISPTDISKAAAVGVDIYVDFKDGLPGILSSGANGFTDSEYNLMALSNELQTDLFNVLKGTNTKASQTADGVNSMLDAAVGTCRKYVRAGVGAPGRWTGTDTFGDLETFNRNIEENGFYVMAGDLDDQSPADRAARKSPLIQIAFREAGAIHSASVILNFF